MKVTDIVMRVLGGVTAILAIALPGRATSLLECVTLLAIGMWSIFYPPGVLGWAKSLRSEIDPMEVSLRRVARVIGSFLILFSALLAYSLAQH